MNLKGPQIPTTKSLEEVDDFGRTASRKAAEPISTLQESGVTAWSTVQKGSKYVELIRLHITRGIALFVGLCARGSPLLY